MRKWRKRLFATISRNSASPVEFFALPVDRTVVVGARIEF
jgi:KUP system potassium uptake protein